MRNPKVGLLPLYLELYDKSLADCRPRVADFVKTIAAELTKRDLEVFEAPVCRVESEFAAAMRSFENRSADAIVTLHAAYSPSLESASALAGTKLPVIVLDTTPAHSFGATQDPGELMFNHGIHGVQDMCNLLIRNGKPFEIEAGHWRESDVLDRVAGWARAARLATSMRRARVGRIGDPFEGMGDFAVPPEVLRATVGVETVPAEPEELSSYMPTADDPEVERERAGDCEKFACEGLDPAAHRTSIRVGLAVRRWMAEEQLTAFTANFMAITRAGGLATMPFLEASKAMARGLGYAGEGDVLTAALVGALASSHPNTTFTEMFCPDWQAGSIFVSHMGEMNVSLMADAPRLIEKSYPFLDVENPVVAVGRLRPGEAVLVDLAPSAGDTLTLIVAPVTVLDVEGEDRMAEMVRGWIRPTMPVEDFLAAYSRSGGTHHLAMVYGDVADEMKKFGTLMGWRVVTL